MNSEKSDLPAAVSETQERKIIVLLCCLAAIHVFVFSAAFPFFNNVDEPAHFDLVLKYSHGSVPRGLETFSADSAIYLSLYSSCAYLGTPDMFPDGRLPPPPWTQPVEKMRQDLAINAPAWQAQTNYEVSQPPLYYALAGLWWRLGKWCGFEGGRLLYWLRFLNILFVAALVLLGYKAARMIFPGQRFLRLAVPALLAFMPQSAFYSIGNDVLSPLCFGAAIILLIHFFRPEIPGVPPGGVIGLMLAATLLAKMTNLPLLAVSVAAMLLNLFYLAKNGKVRAALPALTTLFFCAALPMACWMTWCKCNFGDYTGSKLKMEHFGWTLKPFAEWRHHPIFSPGGVWTYLNGQLATFWQGEFSWHNQPLASPAIDFIYTAISLLLLLLASMYLFRRFVNLTPLQRQALGFALASFIAALAFFALTSVIYDFHDCPNPSREHPYFQAGRMILGALIPFLLLFVYGLERALSFIKGRWPCWLALAGIILFMLISEIAMDWPVFASQYNWFHM